MKKALTLMTVFAAVLFLTACLQPISEVETFTISGWTMKEYYDIGDEDALWTDGVTLDVVYSDGETESLELDSSVNDGTVILTGDFLDDPLGLETTTKGYYSVTIIIDNVSLTVNYYVFDLSLARYVGVSEDYQTISTALSGASAGTTIFVEDGTYGESINVSGISDITIFGESENGVIIDASGLTGRVLFSSNAPNLSLINLTFQDNYSEGGSSAKRFMVKLQTGTNNVIVRNVTIIGPGQDFLNIADVVENVPQAVGGLDLNGIDDALIENVKVTDISRNAMAFSDVSNLRIVDMEIERSGFMYSAWSAIAFYNETTLIEITGIIDESNVGINYSSTPFDGFEFGNVVITNTFNPLSLYDSLDRTPERDFAINVTGLTWEVSVTDFFEDNVDILVYFETESAANNFIQYLETATVTFGEQTFPISAFYTDTEVTHIE